MKKRRIAIFDSVLWTTLSVFWTTLHSAAELEIQVENHLSYTYSTTFDDDCRGCSLRHLLRAFAELRNVNAD